MAGLVQQQRIALCLPLAFITLFSLHLSTDSVAQTRSLSAADSRSLSYAKKKKTKPATTFSLVHTLLSLALFIALRHWLPLNRNLLRVAATVVAVAVAAPADLALSFFWCESFASVARLY